MSATTAPHDTTSGRLGWTLGAAAAVSTLGTQVSVLALPTFVVLGLHAGPIAFSTVTLCEVLPVLLLSGMLGRYLTRQPPRLVMIASDVLRCGLMLLIPLASWAGFPSVALVFVVAASTGLLSAAFDVATQTYVAMSCEPDARGRVNSTLGVGQSVGQIAGPFLGGGLITVLGAANAVTVDAASFLLSAAAVATLHTVPGSPAGDALAPREGRRRSRSWEALTRRPEVLRLSVTGAALNMGGGGLGAIFILYAYRSLHLSAVGLGALYAVYGVASLAGATVAPRLLDRVGIRRLTLVAGTIAAFSLLLIPIASFGAPLMTLVVYEAVFGSAASVWSISFTTYRQNTVPIGQLSEVNAAVRAMLVSTFPVGVVTAGLLADHLGLRTACFALAAVAAASCALYLPPPARSTALAEPVVEGDLR